MVVGEGRGRWWAVVAVLALMLPTAACGRQFADPRGVDSDELDALERAAKTAPADRDDPASSHRAEGASDDEPPEGFDLLAPIDEAGRHSLSELWGPGAFAVLDDGEPVVEWANRDELWNEVVVPVRRACHDAGPPIAEPAFDDPEPLDAAVDAYWNNRSTSGRGTLVSVMCAYTDAGRGPVERYEAHLVATDPDTLEGRVVASSPPFEFVLDDFARVTDLVVARDEELARWVRQQSRVDTDPVEPDDGVGLDAMPEEDEPPASDTEDR